MDSAQQQTAIISGLLSTGDYSSAYSYIADQISGDPNWNSKVAWWFTSAAQINGSDPSVLKDYVFTSNALALNLDPNSAEAFSINQLYSDELAQGVLSDYIDAINNGEVIDAGILYQREINVAVKQLGIPEHLYAGGPWSNPLYDFPIGQVYDSPEKVWDWIENSLHTGAKLDQKYTSDPSPLIDDLADLMRAALAAAKDELNRVGSDKRDAGEDLRRDLGNFIRDMLSDPMVLDLDGDGIELTALAQSATMFDIDGDGVAERTGWVSPQDGFLVHDANANGVVDGVGELFGSANVDAYDELQTYDSNSDGRIDGSDALFSELRIWRDLNSDGISTPDELQTLTEAGIARLNLGYSQVDQLIAGNIVARSGSYVRIDGATRSMGSVEFALKEPGSTLDIPEGADLGNIPALPNLPAYSGTPDLWTAMYFDPILKGMVEDLVFGNQDFETFRDFLDGGFNDVLYRWLGVDTSAPEDPANPYYIEAFEALTGMDIELINNHWLDALGDKWVLLVQQLGVEFLFQAANAEKFGLLNSAAGAIQNLDPESETFAADMMAIVNSTLQAVDNAGPAYDYLDLFTSLAFESATGEITGDFDAFVARFLDDQPSFATTFGSGGGSRATMSEGGENPHPWTSWYHEQGSLLLAVGEAMGLGRDYVLNVTGWRWLSGTLTEHEGTAGNDLLSFTTTYYQPEREFPDSPLPPPVATQDQMLFGYGGNDELRGNDGVDRLVGGTGDDLLKGGSGSDMYIYASGDGLDRITDDSGADDTIFFSSEMNRADLQVTRVVGTNDLKLHFGNPAAGIVLTNQWTSSATAVEHVHFVGEAGLNAGDIASLYLASLATTGADIITGSWASEKLIGLDGNDTLSGADGNDTLEGGSGADTLAGGNHDDALNGGSGNDALDGGAGDDDLAGGTGNDILTGWLGNDSYAFNVGDGQDTVVDYWGNLSGGTDEIVFGASILPGDLVFTQVNGGTDLLLSIAGTTDSILLDNTVVDSDYRIEQVRFANGTILSHADLMTLATAPTAGNDVFYGSYDGETIQSGAGNDTIHAREGNDTLIGGTGNDVLSGWIGNDSYVFNLGDGQDTVQDYWGNLSGGTDAIIFGAGILAGDLVVTQVNGGNDLLLSIAGTTDSILLDNTVTDSDYRIEQVQFANGTVLSHADLMTLSTTPTAGNDIFYGSYDGETIQSGAGNDTIHAREGNDTLIGGSGNDVLSGWTENDSYVFNLGDGQDVVQDYWGNSSGGTDEIVFGAGILPGDVVVTQVNGGNDLLLSITGTTDSILLDNSITDSDYRIEQVRFANGAILSHADLMTLATAPTAGNDTFYGSYDGETIQSGAGNDTIHAREGNDTLTGGSGNDVLSGWTGNDSYVFNLGDGQDTIQDYWGNSSGGTDEIVFGAGILPEDLVVTQVNGGNDLLLSINGPTDSILLDNTITDSDYRIEQVRFADGTVLSHANLMTLATAPTVGNDIFYGSYDGETIQSGAGNDTIHAREGNDTLIGGSGNDVLIGWTGNDSYVFNLGDGQDTVQDYWGNSSGGTDEIVFGAGILAGDLVVTKVNGGNDLLLSIAGTTDSILLDNTITDSDYRIEQVRFSDGTILSHADLMTLATAPPAFMAGSNDMLFSGLESDALDRVPFQLGTLEEDGQERTTYASAVEKFAYDADGNGAGAQMLFAQFSAVQMLSHSDFQII